MSQKKELEKKISKIVKSELDKNNYEDTAWLKAFKEARGDKNEARAIYIEIRTRDLEDEFYEEQEKIESERIEKQNKIDQLRIEKENRLQELKARRDELRENRRLRSLERSNYKQEGNLKSLYQNKNSFIESTIKPFIRGEETLAYSYWVVGFFFSIFFGLPIIILDYSRAEPEGMLLFFSLIYIIAYIIFIIFVNLGIWRSAGFYVVEKNKKKESGFWGYAARVTVVLAIIRFFVEIAKVLK